MYFSEVRNISICLFAKGVILDVDNLPSNVYAQTFSHFFSLHFESFLTSCKFTPDKFLRFEDIPTQSLRHEDNRLSKSLNPAIFFITYTLTRHNGGLL